jgi:hypothetical protein
MSEQKPYSEKDLAQWQLQGRVFEIEIQDGQAVYHFALKEPEWAVLRNVSSMVNQDDLAGAGELILTNCWLGGHDKVRSDVFLKFSACQACVNAMTSAMPKWKVEGGLGKPSA